MSEGAAVYEAGLYWRGTPVKWEASLRGYGCDCRGLVAGAARDAGRPEADEIEARVVGYAGRVDEAALLAGLDRLFVRRGDGEAPQRGDVIALRLPKPGYPRGLVQHLALHDGGEGPASKMLHAYFGDPALVCEVPLGRFWSRRIAGVWAWREIGGSRPCQSPS